ncbi:MAG: hypothetical protein GVY28_03095, partial [Alphaproteobacteria bacterium]|nr:hypothetical protein [Alphaproteobacteria bacterium]
MTLPETPTASPTPAAERRRAHRRFLAAIGLTFGGVLAAVLALNLAVDPLWYVGGNRLTGENYAFDERAAKANLLLADAERYDCLILGS